MNINPRSIFSGLFCGLAVLLLSASEREQEKGFEHIATHPQAQKYTKNNGYGKRLSSSVAYKGKIYFGYGDYLHVNPSVALMALDPETHKFSTEAQLNTEMITNFHVLPDGKLYVPHSDPVNYHRSDVSCTDGSRWVALGSGGFHRVADIVEFQGKLYISGGGPPPSGPDDPWVTVSSDEGKTFERALTLKRPAGVKYDMFSVMGVLNDKLYVQGWNELGAHSVSKVFDGKAWSDGPNLIPLRGKAGRALSFSSRLVYLHRAMSGWSGEMMAFDGKIVKQVNKDVENYTIYRDEIFVIKPDGTVERTKDMGKWDIVTTFAFPARPLSIAVEKDRIYIGLANAEIFRSKFVLESR